MASNEDGSLKKPVVLVVEDESIIRMETVQMIKVVGYVVIDACDTNDAMAILEARHDVCAVFTEIRVPGHLDGMGLARAIAERWPLVRLMLTSSVSKVDDFPADWHYVPKPYASAQIVAALRALFAPRLAVVN
jgi:DNA-binding NtrC family response regulator